MGRSRGSREGREGQDQSEETGRDVDE
jgi:hypothetical protein